MLNEIRLALKNHANGSHAAVAQRFFKTGPGEYGEGDKFIGVRVPAIRKVAREFRELTLEDVESLLKSAIHEERLLALIILTGKFRRGSVVEKRQIYNLYLSNMIHINNWDLVDNSAMHIVGAYLNERNRNPLYKLARSKVLWERRVAIMATFHYIKKCDFADTIAIAEILLHDEEDLIHKAVGWMLREIGNRDRQIEEEFLHKHYHVMPRTMLRYAIEKFPEARRQQYLKGTV